MAAISSLPFAALRGASEWRPSSAAATVSGAVVLSARARRGSRSVVRCVATAGGELSRFCSVGRVVAVLSQASESKSPSVAELAWKFSSGLLEQVAAAARARSTGSLRAAGRTGSGGGGGDVEWGICEATMEARVGAGQWC
jgi:hypothetical protein